MPAAAVRHAWMFRTAAAVFLFFGAAAIWRYGFTDFHAEQRLVGLPAGIAVLLVGVFLLPPKRFAIGISALTTGFVGLCAAVFAPSAKGPAILFLAGLAAVCVVYAVFAARAMFSREAS